VSETVTSEGVGRLGRRPGPDPAAGPVLSAGPGPIPRIGVLLAAGSSERFHPMTGGGSKALVRLGGLPLVERAVRSLLALGLEEVVVVVGYRARPVAAAVGRIAPGRVRAVYAERWEAGNGASLAAAEELVADEPLFLLQTTDHVFTEGAQRGLIRAGRPAVLVDLRPETSAWAEGTRVHLEGTRVLALGKHLERPAIDCGVFLLPPTVFECQRRAAAEGDFSLARAVTRLSQTIPVTAIPLPPGHWWQDIDTPEDLRAARVGLRRSLVRESDGPVSRYLNRPLSTRLSMALAPLRLSPDLMSLVAFLLGVLAAGLLAAGEGVLGGVTAHVASVVDGVDGEVARLQIRARPRGAMLDGVLDRLADAAIMAGLALWALDSAASPSLVLVLAVAATTGALLSMATKDRAAALGLVPAPERALAFLLGGRDGRLLLVAVGSLAGRPTLTLIAVSVTSALSLALRLLLVGRGPRAV
jgi:1L-myo-inositol 1-phosphate cytidylyltransferase / CDP-L-myo-inositol myo-inositolphosphotransferase